MSFSPSSAENLEAIVGGMFSGRTEALITRLRHALPVPQKTRIFKPVIDNRHTTHDIISHNTLFHTIHSVCRPFRQVLRKKLSGIC